MSSILITGASGFVGCEILTQLLKSEESVKLDVAVRKLNELWPKRVFQHVINEIDGGTDWSSVVKGKSTVIHCAARAHILHDKAINPLQEFRRINVDGTLNLARQSVKAGVRRFIFLSSIGVNGAETFLHPFTEFDTAAPHSPYAMSKYEAELGLQILAAETGIEIVIIRSPLVYGPKAPGNFGSLMRWIRSGVPLPLGSINNRRSLVSINNLVDLILICVNHPAASNQVFFVSDNEDVSTTELLRRMGKAMGNPARLVPIPSSFLRMAATALGRREIAIRLCGSLQVDIEKTRRLLGWNPPLSLDEGLKKAAEGGASEKNF
ncbi:MAG: SDR family oxidoreductase [Comamonas sp.]|uniref:UDP-glucose 4-epimerase family protein n=1 Tax=Comamonas sp. TaxID=34028 RepID=UPI002FC5A8BD